MITSKSLPEKEAGILREIRKKYKVAFEPLEVAGSTVQLLQVTDLEAILGGKDPFKNVSEFPFWIKLWEASIVLANIVTSLKPDPNHSILELGAGLGAPGLIAAAKGFQVTLSDYEPLIMNFQRVSSAASGLNNIDFKMVDWTKPPAMGNFDTLIGAEILFRDELFQPLLNVFDQYLAPGGTIYLAHDQRRKSLGKFLALAEKDYKIMTKKVDISADQENKAIIVNRLQRR